MSSVAEIAKEFFSSYGKQSRLLRIIDVFIVWAMVTGLVQLVYMSMVGTFPFNSFLSGFLACVGEFVLLVSLRMHLNPSNHSSGTFKGVEPERAFGDFIFGNVLLFLATVNFMG